jgi:hypothetical protein
LVGGVLFLIVIVGVATEAGPTAFVAAVLLAVTLYARSRTRDVPRLLAASACFLILGAAASFILTERSIAIGTWMFELTSTAILPESVDRAVADKLNDLFESARGAGVVQPETTSRTFRCGPE